MKELDRMVSKKGFGKKMGNDLYFHKMYESEVISQDLLKQAKKAIGDFKYTIIKYNETTGSISFIQSPDFNTADEPVVKDSIKVNSDGTKKYRKSPKRDQIYHHKWQMVKPDYTGFNYQESKNRSLSWFKQHEYDSRIIGYKDYWDKLPFNEHFILEYLEPKVDYFPSRTSVKQVSAGLKILGKISKSDTINLDYGGGKYNLGTEYLKEKGIKNVILDEYSRDEEWNTKVKNFFKRNPADTVTVLNVLNVIHSPDERKEVIQDAFSMLKTGGLMIITIYEGTKPESGLSKNKTWQENRKISTYMEEVETAINVLPELKSKMGKKYIYVTKQ